MRSRTLLLPAFVLACVNAFAQSALTPVTLRPVVYPDMTIGGNPMWQCHAPISTRLNDVGDVAFLATCYPPAESPNTTLFTSKRVIVVEGERIDGKVMKELYFNSVLAINNHGKVLYYAEIPDGKSDSPTALHMGLFLDRHLVFESPSLQPARMTTMP